MSDSSNRVRRLDRTLIERAAKYGSATIHEAMGQKGAFPYGIKPIALGMSLCGPALTISSPPKDNLMIHRAIALAEPGDILVVEVGGAYEGGYWGEIMTFAAQQRGIAGLVIDGCVRDGTLVHEMKFPVFSRGLSIRGTGKKGGGTINQPIKIGDIVVAHGDLIVGDGDGVVAIPQGIIPEALEQSKKREEKEKQIMKELAAGKTTVEIFGWPKK